MSRVEPDAQANGSSAAYPATAALGHYGVLRRSREHAGARPMAVLFSYAVPSERPRAWSMQSKNRKFPEGKCRAEPIGECCGIFPNGTSIVLCTPIFGVAEVAATAPPSSGLNACKRGRWHHAAHGNAGCRGSRSRVCRKEVNLFFQIDLKPFHFSIHTNPSTTFLAPLPPRPVAPVPRLIGPRSLFGGAWRGMPELVSQVGLQRREVSVSGKTQIHPNAREETYIHGNLESPAFVPCGTVRQRTT